VKSANWNRRDRRMAINQGGKGSERYGIPICQRGRTIRLYDGLNWGATMGKIIATMLSALFFVLLIEIFVLVKTVHALDNTNAIRDAQLLLTLKRLYTGPIDGQCNTKTREAIADHEGIPDYTTTICSTFLEYFNEKLKSSISTDPSNPSDIPRQSSAAEQNNIDQLALAKVRSDLDKTVATIQGLREGISTHFTTLAYNNATALGTYFLSIIAILVAIISVGTTILVNTTKTKIEGLHNSLLDRSQVSLREMIENFRNEQLSSAKTARQELAANIYTQFAGHCINLYKDFREPAPAGNDNKIYSSYLNIAVELANNGYQNSNLMRESLRTRHEKPSTTQQAIITDSLNNFIFYLSSRGTQEDSAKISRALPELQRIIDQGQTIPLWYEYIDTMAWAKLHLGVRTAQETRAEIQRLFDNRAISHAWKIATKERYEFYDKVQRTDEFAGLRVPPPPTPAA
jgi:hypothetical protein